MASAAEPILTGCLLPAAEAEALGLCNWLVPAADALDGARRLAMDIVENTAPVAVATAKRLLWRGTLERLLPKMERRPIRSAPARTHRTA
jgi:enoyl-CoA hydratase/carnithine racemase